jgi:predicted GNAT family acetyltransferase
LISINKSSRSFYVGDSENKPLAEVVFHYKGNKIIEIDRTFVSEPLRGKNIAEQMLKKLAEWARCEEIKIIPVCPFAKKKMLGSDDYKDVLYSIKSD